MLTIHNHDKDDVSLLWLYISNHRMVISNGNRVKGSDRVQKIRKKGSDYTFISSEKVRDLFSK